MRDAGETCVIELGGLSAKSLKNPCDRTSFREQRINLIKERLRNCDSTPELVVMYGYGSAKTWNYISNCNLKRGDIKKLGRTLFAFMPGPTAPGQNNEEWIQLGKRIAEQSAVVH